MSVLGTGATCCGDNEGCDLGCFSAPDLETVVDEPAVELSDEEDDE